jgi:hypothetical protein
MKNYRIFLLLICFRTMPAQLKSNRVDTIYCTNQNTSYILFKDRVELVDIGKPSEYVSRIEDNSVFVKSLNGNAGVSTLLVKTEKEFYYGILQFREENKIFFYDFRAADHSQPSEIEKPAALLAEKGIVERKAAQVLAKKNELYTLGFISRFMDAAVTLIRNDEKNTFLKIVVKNKSSIPYRLDFISFQYFRHLKKGFVKKAKAEGMDVFPLASPAMQEILPFSCQPLAYAIPSFGLADKGYLMVSFRESSGDRVLKIKVGGAEIQQAQVFENGK